MIYWQIKQSQAAKKWLFVYFISFLVHSSVMYIDVNNLHCWMFYDIFYF